MAIETALAIASAATAALGQGGNMYAQGKMNAKNRGFAEDMWKKEADQRIGEWDMQNKYNLGLWEKQKQYNEQLWHMQNNYDSPAAQMQRFKDAGLNPNLIYGQNNMGGSIDPAQISGNDAGSVQSVNAPAGKAPQMDLGSVAELMGNVRATQLSANNMELDAELKRKEMGIKDAQESGLRLDNMQKLFNYDFSSEMRGVSADYKRAQLNNLQSVMDQRLYNYDLDVANLDLKKTQVGQFVKQSNQAIDESVSRTASNRLGLGLIQEKILSENAGRNLLHNKNLTEEQKLMMMKAQQGLIEAQKTNADTQIWMDIMKMIIGQAGKSGR